jgi:hypothetical protein
MWLDSGWNFAPALNFCQTTGVAQESSAPYSPNNQPCPSVSSTLKITAWSQVLTMDDRKNVLASKGPVVGGLAVYSDFFDYKSGVYRHRTGDLEGYHAISVVGYDDAQSCWICKNSWGPGWGDAGYFRMAYGDESGMDTQFAFYDVDLKCPDEGPPPPPDDCRQYVPFLVRVLTAARTNPRLRACLAYYICRMGRRPLCSSSQIQIVRLVLAILRRCPQYLEPFCRALR